MRFVPRIRRLCDPWLGTREVRSAHGRSRARRRSFVPSVELLECRVNPVGTNEWTGGGGSVDWSDTGNWSLGRGPQAGDDLVFGASAPAASRDNFNNIVGLSLNSITIQSDDYLFSGERITLGISTGGNPLIVNAGARNNLISFDITLAGGPGNRQTFFVGAGGDVSIDGRIFNSTGVELAKRDSGILILGADNFPTFNGPVTVLEGIVRITHANALGNLAAPTTVQQNAQLQFDGNLGTVGEQLLLSGPGVVNDGALLNRSGNSTLSGSVILDADATLGSASGVLTITGIVSDTGAGHNLTKEGPSEIRFTRDNSYRGLTTINDGILTIQTPFGLGPGGTGANSTIVNDDLVKTGQLRLMATSGSGFTVRDELLTLNGTGGAPGRCSTSRATIPGPAA